MTEKVYEMVREEVAPSASTGDAESRSTSAGATERDRAPLRETPSTKNAKSATASKAAAAAAPHARKPAKHGAPQRQQTALTTFFKPQGSLH